MKRLAWITLGCLISLTLAVWAQSSYNYFAPGGALSCTAPCTSQSVNLNSGASLLNTLPNNKLANSTFTLNGTSVALGGTRTLTLASSDFANQGTTTTLYHGNAAGNPSFGPVNLGTEVTGTLSLANLTACATNRVVFASSATTAACSSKFTYTDSTTTLTLDAGASVSPNITCPTCVVNVNPLNISAGTGPGGINSAVQITTYGNGPGQFDTFRFGNNDFVMESGNGTPNTGYNGDLSFFILSDNITGNNVRSTFQIGDEGTSGAIWDCLGSGFNLPNPDFTGIPASIDHISTCNLGTQNFGTQPFIFGTAGAYAGFLANDQGWVFGSPTGLSKGSGSLNATHLYSNGTELKAVLSCTTGSIGGGALLAGACTSGTCTATGATTGMAAVSSPVTYPGDGSTWLTYVSSSNTVTVKVCAVVALTPSASNYNARVLQ